MAFTTHYPAILNSIHTIDPVKYAQNRNYLAGNVTHLSPYISRGVISLLQIKNNILQQYTPAAAKKLLQELAWREYWQRVWQQIGDAIFTDLKHPQQHCLHKKIPTAFINASTGITAIDTGIKELYAGGYMHNHVRMYTASVACNIAGAHWLQPAKWLYYHLLDGDIASNALSWQWVAGTNAAKKYYCNQENINHYTQTHQAHSYLHTTYGQLAQLPVPEVLKDTTVPALYTTLPQTNAPVLNHALPLCIYNTYNLDPLWLTNTACNRVLLLEPEHFQQHAVSEKVLAFIIALAGNIAGLQVYTGSFESLRLLYKGNTICFKKHPAFLHYKGYAYEYEWMYPQVNGYYPSFSAYWKKCEPLLMANK